MSKITIEVFEGHAPRDASGALIRSGTHNDTRSVRDAIAYGHARIVEPATQAEPIETPAQAKQETVFQHRPASTAVAAGRPVRK